MFAQIIRRRLALSARQNGSHIRSSSRTYATRPGSASYRPSLGVTAVIASAFTLALTQLWSTRTVVSADTGTALPGKPQAEGKYATPKEVEKVIKLLREKLGEDKVTINPDELLGHGSSPNTYHGERAALARGVTL
jgi:hypothetical protein